MSIFSPAISSRMVLEVTTNITNRKHDYKHVILDICNKDYLNRDISHAMILYRIITISASDGIIWCD